MLSGDYIRNYNSLNYLNTINVMLSKSNTHCGEVGVFRFTALATGMSFPASLTLISSALR
jgi:hypothetical protein